MLKLKVFNFNHFWLFSEIVSNVFFLISNYIGLEIPQLLIYNTFFHKHYCLEGCYVLNDKRIQKLRI